METARFETFADAIIAIAMTVLVLKIPQPENATIGAFLALKTYYIAYFISFLTLFNIWYSNHNLFQIVENIDNTALILNGILIFEITLIPYFTLWLTQDAYSIASETMFGLLFISVNIVYNLAVKAVHRSDPYNDKLIKANYDALNPIPLIIILIGFALSYTVFIPGIYISCLLAVIMWIIISRIHRKGVENGK
ncbi:TMEM175 family protein [uncultured Methanobrevibacter sp.]|uniref:TMEM175 family protein n=1 Tax=uncultured Methanobrevibacter sp. TaxID=253161 RepID=UPI002615176A|nr:TMEM175 family protein [uncultured Methanobrevibacter sp.]